MMEWIAALSPVAGSAFIIIFFGRLHAHETLCIRNKGVSK